jgi:hypothetical protein
VGHQRALPRRRQPDRDSNASVRRQEQVGGSRTADCRSGHKARRRSPRRATSRPVPAIPWPAPWMACIAAPSALRDPRDLV